MVGREFFHGVTESLARLGLLELESEKTPANHSIPVVLQAAKSYPCREVSLITVNRFSFPAATWVRRPYGTPNPQRLSTAKSIYLVSGKFKL